MTESTRLLAILVAVFFIMAAFNSASAAGEGAAAAAGTAPGSGASIILATTYSVADTGLLDELLKEFTYKTGISVKPIIVGSGESLKMGERGECDVILAHSKDLEEKFMSDGFGRDRKSIARNEFYLVGPEADPAKVAAAKDIYRAYSLIDKGGIFVSRGDKSGTHNREMAIWKKAGIEKKASDKYIVTGQGMAETLRMADEKLGYTMCDSATFTVLQDKIRVKKLLADPSNLTNIYSVITVNPEKVKTAKYDPAKKFFDFMFDKSTLDRIAKYGVDKYRSPLFILLDGAGK